MTPEEASDDALYEMVLRHEKVAEAVHSGRLSGLEPSAEFLVDADEYIRGLIGADEVIARARR